MSGLSIFCAILWPLEESRSQDLVCSLFVIKTNGGYVLMLFDAVGSMWISNSMKRTGGVFGSHAIDYHDAAL
jgi:hypothetical protein